MRFFEIHQHLIDMVLDQPLMVLASIVLTLTRSLTLTTPKIRGNDSRPSQLDWLLETLFPDQRKCRSKNQLSFP